MEATSSEIPLLATPERTTGQLDPQDLSAILKYLDLPGPDLPSSPYTFLSQNIENLPKSLLIPFGALIPPRQRSSIPTIKSRRYLYATSSPPPKLLTANYGRLRWPLLWERLGGSRIPPDMLDVDDDESWVRDSFLPGEENKQHVKKLGGFLRDLAEEREWEGMMVAKRVERRLDDQGEEFDDDSESDDEEGDQRAENGIRPNGDGGIPEEEEDQEEVNRLFEKRLLELFVDGLDTIPYDDIDFTEPPGGDVIRNRDVEDQWFEDESPSLTDGHGNSKAATSISISERLSEIEAKQNGTGEYDY